MNMSPSAKNLCKSTWTLLPNDVHNRQKVTLIMYGNKSVKVSFLGTDSRSIAWFYYFLFMSPLQCNNKTDPIFVGSAEQ